MGLCCKGLSLSLLILTFSKKSVVEETGASCHLGIWVKCPNMQMLSFSSSDCVHRFQQSIAKVLYIRKLFCETKISLFYFCVKKKTTIKQIQGFCRFLLSLLLLLFFILTIYIYINLYENLFMLVMRILIICPV